VKIKKLLVIYLTVQNVYWLLIFAYHDIVQVSVADAEYVCNYTAARTALHEGIQRPRRVE
jgi:hypothetical protein